MTVRMRTAIITSIVAVTAAVSGCGHGSSPPAAPTGSAPTGAFGGAPTPIPGESSTITATAAAPSSSAPAVILPDGRSPILVTSVDVPARTITFDLIELFLGLDAEKEWRKDNPGVTEVPPLNGHYMRNSNPKLRTLPVSTSVVVKVVDNGDPSHPTSIPFVTLPTYPRLRSAAYWITVKYGEVTLIEQQFTP